MFLVESSEKSEENPTEILGNPRKCGGGVLATASVVRWFRQSCLVGAGVLWCDSERCFVVLAEGRADAALVLL